LLVCLLDHLARFSQYLLRFVVSLLSPLGHHFHFLAVFPAPSWTSLFLFLWRHDGSDVNSFAPAAAVVVVVDVIVDVDVDVCDAVVVPVRAGEQLVGWKVWFGATSATEQ